MSPFFTRTLPYTHSHPSAQAHTQAQAHTHTPAHSPDHTELSKQPVNLCILQKSRRGESTIISSFTKIRAMAKSRSVSSDLADVQFQQWSVNRTIYSEKQQNESQQLYESHSHSQQEHQLDSHSLMTRLKRIGLDLRDSLTVTFLPKSYPASVTRDYLPYTTWQFLHSVTGTVTGTLSTQALLHALGMGAGAALGLAATTNWIIKDGFGLLGGVVFAGVVADRFDSHPRRYRFLAALAIQLSTFAELMTPLVPHLFLPMASLSNVGKNVGWLASSATRASMHRGFARGDNLGDITGKSGAQGTLAGLVGTVAGIGVSWVMGTDPVMLLKVFIPLSVFNLWCCYRASMAVVTRTLNVERGELAVIAACKSLTAGLIEHQHKERFSSSSSSSSSTTTKPTANTANDARETLLSLIASPECVSRKEFFVLPSKSHFDVPLDLEPTLTPSFLSTLSEGSLKLLQWGPHCHNLKAVEGNEASLKHSPLSSSEEKALLELSKPVEASSISTKTIPPSPSTQLNYSTSSTSKYRILIIAGGSTALSTSKLNIMLSRLSQSFSFFSSFSSSLSRRLSPRVALWYTDAASSPDDHFEGFLHACLVRAWIEQEQKRRSGGQKGQTTILLSDDEVLRVMRETGEVLEEWKEVVNRDMVEKGWRVHHNHFGDKDAKLIFF